MYGYSISQEIELKNTLFEEAEIVEDQVHISKKARRQLFKQKVYHWMKANFS